MVFLNLTFWVLGIYKQDFLKGDHRWDFVQSHWAKINTPLFHSFVLKIGKHPYHYSIKGTQITRFVKKKKRPVVD